MNSFATYYKHRFREDLLTFLRQIPVESKHYNEKEPNIQYFQLIPFYNYLDIIPPSNQANFTVSLFWTVLIDQVFYSNYYFHYPKFRGHTRYPKFIGNCTAPSLMSSQCGHNQHPKRIIEAVNDFHDTGNTFEFDRQIFKRNERLEKRNKIYLTIALEEAQVSMQDEIRDYFERYHPDIGWEEFLGKCVKELSVKPLINPF